MFWTKVRNIIFTTDDNSSKIVDWQHYFGNIRGFNGLDVPS